MRYKSETCLKRDGTGKTTYSTEEEAKEGAEFAKNKYNSDLEPYQCKECNEYHLGPKRDQN